MIELPTAERIALRLLLAYLDPDQRMRPAFVMQVQAESGLPDAAFDLANVTAWEAAQFWLTFDPELGRRMLQEKLDSLVAA